MGLCDRDYVILRTNRARCALNKEMFNEENVSGARSGRFVTKFDKKSTASV